MADDAKQMQTMSFQQLLDHITPEIYENLKRAVELGKWPDGNALTKEQRGLCLQAVIAWETKHLPENKRTGYIPPREHGHCGGDGEIAEPEPLKWQ